MSDVQASVSVLQLGSARRQDLASACDGLQIPLGQIGNAPVDGERQNHAGNDVDHIVVSEVDSGDHEENRPDQGHSPKGSVVFPGQDDSENGNKRVPARAAVTRNSCQLIEKISQKIKGEESPEGSSLQVVQGKARTYGRRQVIPDKAQVEADQDGRSRHVEGGLVPLEI